jgi:hypothetical protein
MVVALARRGGLGISKPSADIGSAAIM